MASGGDKAFYDEAFAQIAQRAGNIHNLLDEFFDFLHRRTDFYVTFPQPTDISTGKQYKMGFPEGMAESMVLKALRKRKFKDYSSTNAESSSAPTSQPKTSSTSSSSALVRPLLNEDGKQIPVGNGGVCERYYWNQTLAEVTIYIDAPIGIKSKAIQCKFSTTSLHLSLNGNVIIDGSLDDIIRPQESMWTISKGDDQDAPQIVITLEKAKETWWSRVIVGDPEIDTSKVDSSKSIHEYDPETQGAIRKIIHEQRQKVKFIAS